MDVQQHESLALDCVEMTPRNLASLREHRESFQELRGDEFWIEFQSAFEFRLYTQSDITELNAIYHRHAAFASYPDVPPVGFVAQVDGNFRLISWLRWYKESGIPSAVELAFREVIVPRNLLEVSIPGFPETDDERPLWLNAITGSYLSSGNIEMLHILRQEGRSYQQNVLASLGIGPGTLGIGHMTHLRSLHEHLSDELECLISDIASYNSEALNTIKVVIAEAVYQSRVQRGTVADDCASLIESKLRGDVSTIFRCLPFETHLQSEMLIPAKPIGPMPNILFTTARQGVLAILHRRQEYVERACKCAARLYGVNALLRLASHPDPVPGVSKSPGRPFTYPQELTELWFLEVEGLEEYQHPDRKKKIIDYLIDEHAQLHEGKHIPDRHTIVRQLERLGIKI